MTQSAMQVNKKQQAGTNPDAVPLPARLLVCIITLGLVACGQKAAAASTSPSAHLLRLDAVEVFDDFPNLAVLSTSYENGSPAELKLDKVVALQQRLDASLIDAKARPYEMWSFQGASLNWGNDEVLPISAKFAQENVMAAPVNYGHGGESR